MNLCRFLSLTITVGTLLSTALPAAEPARAVNPATVWDLTLLYPNEAAWRAAKEQVATGIPKVKTYEGRLGESAATLREAMDCLYGLRKEFGRLETYASLSLDEDTRNAAALEREQELGLLGTEFSRATSYLNPELLAVGEAKVRGFLDADPELAPYRFPIMEILRAAPHTLGSEAEGVLSATGLVTDRKSTR